jgi:hypothetical protein
MLELHPKVDWREQLSFRNLKIFLLIAVITTIFARQAAA